MKAYVFPGQGSQHVDMGKTLFGEFPELVKRINSNLGYSIEELCTDKDTTRLNNTLYTQVALYVVNALAYFSTLREDADRPEVVAGHSLGEYNALLAAEVFDFFTGLELVKQRASLMSKANGGAMAAVVGLDANLVEAVLEKHQLKNVGVANINSFKQLVISGVAEEVNRSVNYFKEAGAKAVVPLKVSGAFHSRLMVEAEEAFGDFMKQFTFSKPRIRVMSNYTGQEYRESDLFSCLKKQISNPVQWCRLASTLDKEGADFREVGPGTVLTGIIKNIKANR